MREGGREALAPKGPKASLKPLHGIRGTQNAKANSLKPYELSSRV